MIPRLMPFGRLLLLASFSLLLLAGACSRAAELIPDDPSPAAPTTPVAEETAATAGTEPILPPGALRQQEPTGERAAAPIVPDSELARSVVQLQLLDDGTNVPLVVRNGSGVVVNTELGLLLTTYTLTNPFQASGVLAYSRIAIGTNRTPGQEPRLEFEAELVAADRRSDLALLQVRSAFGGGPLASGDFDLPAVELGDPGELRQGDPLRLFGHPGLDPAVAGAPQPVLVANSVVRAFRGDVGNGGRSWIETDTRLPYGSAGGPAFDESGALIGVMASLAYDAAATIGQVRLIARAVELLDQAGATAGSTRELPVAPQHPGPVPGTSIPAPSDGIAVGRPAFAENAVEGQNVRSLFDYAQLFPAQLAELHYEFPVQGAPTGAVVQELWYLNGVLQDSLSSSYTWSFGSFAVIADRLVAPTTQGIPNGTWTLEVWIDGALRSSNSALVGIPPGSPAVGLFRFSSVAAADHGPAGPAFGSAQQLLAFFDYRDAGSADTLRWVVFREGRLVYQSPATPWEGGAQGTWWVGFRDPAGVGPGRWEFEIYFDNHIAGTGEIQLF